MRVELDRVPPERQPVNVLDHCRTLAGRWGLRPEEIAHRPDGDEEVFEADLETGGWTQEHVALTWLDKLQTRIADYAAVAYGRRVCWTLTEECVVYYRLSPGTTRRSDVSPRDERRTLVVDLDGVVLQKLTSGGEQHCTFAVIGHGRAILQQAAHRGDCVVLMTGRREGQRAVLTEALAKAGVPFDHLVMGVGGGVRYLVNDRRDGEDRAVAVNVEANQPWSIP